MYIATIPNRSSPPAILLRESYRQGGQVKTRTLANLTDWPPAQLDALRHVLRGDLLVAPDDAFEIVRSLPHGHVAAVLGTVRRLGLDALIAAKKSGHRELVLAMIVARLLAPQSKLATARGLGPDTVLSQSSIFGQNSKIGCQKFNDLQTPKPSKKQLCDRTLLHLIN